jgi:PAS domain S-box-containing protein
MERSAFRLVLVIIVVTAAFLLRQILVVRFGIPVAPFITFYPTVLILALLFGFRSGLLATMMSAALASYWIFPHHGQWELTNTSDVIKLTIFVALSIFISVMAGRYKRGLEEINALQLQEAREHAQLILDRQQTLISALDEAFVSCEMLYDESGTPNDYRVLVVNQAYEKQIGMKAEDVLGKTALEVFPTIEKSWIERFGKVATTGISDRFENYNHNVGRHFETFAYSPERGKFIALIHDVSERKRTAERLSESEHWLRLFIEHAPAALAMFDDKMCYMHVSNRWKSVYGLGDRDLRGLPHYDIFPELSERWKEAHRRGLAGEVVSHEADRFDRLDGSVQWARWEVRPWYAAEGKVGGIVIFTEDITDRRRAEGAVRESRAKLDGIVSSAMDAVISVNEQQRIVVFNRAAETIFQCVSSEVIGETLDRFIPAALREGHGEHIRCFGMEGATARSMTSPAILTAVRSNGEEFPIEATISQMQSEGEKLFTVILRDITERKRAEDKLRRSEDQLRAFAARLERAGEKERLRIARELHDQMGSVLTGLKMDLDWIVRKHGTEKNAWVPLVQQSMHAVDSTIALVRQLATELRPEILDAAGLGAAIEWETQQFRRRMGIQCTVEVPEELLHISSDQKIAIYRICQEALTNIARHSQARNVSVTLAQEQTHLLLTIQDDGVGFSMDAVSNTSALGILGMRERSLALNAELQIDSLPGRGTTLRLTMPLEETGEL